MKYNRFFPRFNNFISILFLSLFCPILFGCIILPRNENIRKVELYFVDDKTDEPIPNITVSYILKIAAPENIAQVDYIIIDEKKLLSNNAGKIEIPNRIFSLWSFQQLSNECFYINVDFTDEYKQWYKDYLKMEFDYYHNMFSYFSLYTDREGIYFPNNNFYPVFMCLDTLNTIEGSYIIKQISDSKDKKQAFTTFHIESKLGKIESQKIIIRMIRRNNI
jgi:hypothetical protein